MIRVMFDNEREAMGIDASASNYFDAAHDPQANLELLAALVAKANCMAAVLIGDVERQDSEKKKLYELYAALKEELLNDMISRLEEAE